MDISKLLAGIAVIIDNEINKPETDIFKIKAKFLENNIPVAVYEYIPSEDIIISLSNASFVVLDWDFNDIDELSHIDSGERVSIGAYAKEIANEKLINFIKKIQNSIFVPLFIFTYKPVPEIISVLSDKGLWNEGPANRIFVKSKGELFPKEQKENNHNILFESIEEWMKNTPSIHALKAWDRVLSDTKDRMFLEMQSYSPKWTKIIWDRIAKDSQNRDIAEQFGAFLTRNLVNRVCGYSFLDKIFVSTEDIEDKDCDTADLRKVIEAERYMDYTMHQPELVYTGDLFKNDKKYYLNITAQCDTMRGDTTQEYNPRLYCIFGEELKDKNIKREIMLTEEGCLKFSDHKQFNLKDERNQYCCSSSDLDEINNAFIKHRNSIFYHNGELLEKKTEVIVSCVAGGKHLKFSTKVEVLNFNDIKEIRIGRILPPYITRIQQKCASNMIREGLMPLPSELFE